MVQPLLGRQSRIMQAQYALLVTPNNTVLLWEQSCALLLTEFPVVNNQAEAVVCIAAVLIATVSSRLFTAATDNKLAKRIWLDTCSSAAWAWSQRVP